MQDQQRAKRALPSIFMGCSRGAAHSPTAIGGRAALTFVLMVVAGCHRSTDANRSAPANTLTSPTRGPVAPTTNTAPAPVAGPDSSSGATPSAALDAGATLIDLLHASAAEVRVTSRVANHTDIPQNLVDGRLDTAWSSRTGDLVGAEIDVRIPENATVDHFALTVGMTRSGPEGDLFPMNPRIREVRVYRGYESLGRFPLDPSSPAMQTVPIHRPGGIYRIIVTAIADGTRRDWREISVSEFEARGTIAAPQPNVPRVQVGRILPAEMPPAYALPATPILEPGCFAFSLLEHAALCVHGRHGHLNDEADGHEWIAHVAGTNDFDDIDLHDGPDAASEDWDIEQHPIPTRAVTALNARIAAGHYVDLSYLREPMSPGLPIEWDHGASLRWTRRQTFAGGENAAERFTDRIEVRWGAREPWVLIAGEEDQPVYDPDVNVYLVPGDRFAVVSTNRHHGDEGIAGTVADGWLCDARTRTCE